MDEKDGNLQTCVGAEKLMVGSGMSGMRTNDDSHLEGATCLSMENASGLVLDKTQQSLCPKTQSQLWDMRMKCDQLWDVRPVENWLVCLSAAQMKIECVCCLRVN